MEYDFFAFDKSPPEKRKPVFVRSIVREHHATETDVLLPEADTTIETVEYSDGFGRRCKPEHRLRMSCVGDPNFGGGVLSSDQSVVIGDAVGRRRAESDPRKPECNRQRLADLRQQGPRRRKV
jgi:hypothetical protein